MVSPIASRPDQPKQFQSSLAKVQIIALFELKAVLEGSDDCHGFWLNWRGEVSEEEVSIVELYLEKLLVIGGYSALFGKKLELEGVGIPEDLSWGFDYDFGVFLDVLLLWVVKHAVALIAFPSFIVEF